MTSGERRCSWIAGLSSAFLECMLHVSGYVVSHGSTFKECCAHHSGFLRNRCGNYSPGIPAIDDTSHPRESIGYLFELEAELWSNDILSCTSFFANNSSHDQSSCTQTFHFVHAFYLIERWLSLFLSGHSKKNGRGRMRKTLFGKDDGLFAVRCADSLGMAGPPFSLMGSPRRVDDLTVDNLWNACKSSREPDPMQTFYRRACAGKDHFSQVLESAFRNARRKLPEHLFSNESSTTRRRKMKGVRACWYDVLWMCSESVRYHDFCVPEILRQNGRDWNRTILWFASLCVNVLILLLATNPDNKSVLASSWHDALQRNEILNVVFSDSRESLFG
jgi:hypothetical protein